MADNDDDGNSKSTTLQSDINRPVRQPKLSKQERIDEEENGVIPCDTETDKSGDVAENSKEPQFPNVTFQLASDSGNRTKPFTRTDVVSAANNVRFGENKHVNRNFVSSQSNCSSSFSFDSNSEIYTDSTGIDLHSFIVSTLHKNAKDRTMLLQCEEQMTMLINDNTRNSYKFLAMSSYNRMLVHRTAAFFGLDHNVNQNGTAVVVNKTSQSRIPDVKFESLIRNDLFSDESRRLRRDTQSYEEGRRNLATYLIPDRRACSFELAAYSPQFNSNILQPGACTFTPRQQWHLGVYQRQQSTSTGIYTTPMIGSSGSYSQSEMPYIGMYSSSENSCCGSISHGLYQRSGSEGYNSCNSSFDQTSGVIYPLASASGQQRTTDMLPNSEGANFTMYPNVNMCFGITEDQNINLKQNYSEIGEFPLSTEESGSDPMFLKENLEVMHAQASNPPLLNPPANVRSAPCYKSMHNDNAVYGPCIVGTATPCPQHGLYTSFVEYPVQRPSIQDMNQQMESVHLSDRWEVSHPQLCAYIAPKNYSTSMDQGLVQRVNYVCQNRPYYVPVISSSGCFIAPAQHQPTVIPMHLASHQPPPTQMQVAGNVVKLESPADGESN